MSLPIAAVEKDKKRRDPKLTRPCRSPAYMSTYELAVRWGVTEGHLRNRRVAGRAPRYFVDGGIVRYNLADIEQHETDHTVTSTTTKKSREDS